MSLLQVKQLVKSVFPPVFHRPLKKVYDRLGLNGIDASSKFSGKVFCVGFHKTGTTSIETVFRNFGYCVGDQPIGEQMMFEVHGGHYDRLIRFCETAQAFQDTPFCFPGIYRVLDEAFADAKFVLTVRDSDAQWFQSLVRFHTARFSSDKDRPPTETDLDAAVYRYRGYVLDLVKCCYGYPDIALYDPLRYQQLYRDHNQSVMDYFRDRPDRLLVLNVAEPDAYQKLGEFLNVKVSTRCRFPWENRTCQPI